MSFLEFLLFSHKGEGGVLTQSYHWPNSFLFCCVSFSLTLAMSLVSYFFQVGPSDLAILLTLLVSPSFYLHAYLKSLRRNADGTASSHISFLLPVFGCSQRETSLCHLNPRRSPHEEDLNQPVSSSNKDHPLSWICSAALRRLLGLTGNVHFLPRHWKPGFPGCLMEIY